MTTLFKENEKFNRTFLLKAISSGKTRGGKPFVTLTLGTPQQDFEGRLWDTDLETLPSLLPGDPVNAAGTAVLYQERIQLKVDRIAGETSAIDPRSLYPSSEFSEEELGISWRKWVKKITDENLNALFAAIERDGAFMKDFLRSPAAVTMHHARIGGLAEHSLGVCALAGAVGEKYTWLRPDILIAGALLHDIGKVREYEIARAFQVSTEGRLMGHIALGIPMLKSYIEKVPGFPEALALELYHIILSHHGKLELGSPKAPSIPEALVVHYADDLDAKLDMLRASRISSSREGAGDPPGEYVRGLGRFFLFPGDEKPVIRKNPSGKTGADDQGKLF
ncbi:MAG TPA: HD domain-containing protein [Proteobacteria bacterium]|nr:3'-5' exoribonuclease YhaM [bacterium BMS3Abin14]HDL53935.1 HD domain-containing protein [Pseudomonadota bacterium]